MNSPKGLAALVIVLVVVGAVVWALRTNPLLSLWVLLGMLAVWEIGRRSRYRHSLRFLPPPRARGARPPAPVVHSIRAAGTGRGHCGIGRRGRRHLSSALTHHAPRWRDARRYHAGRDVALSSRVGSARIAPIA